MHQYHALLRHILDNGYERADRTGVGTIGVFGYQTRYNLPFGFPLVTTKKLFTKAIVHELLWFLAGDTNIKYLNDNGVKIWDEWADANGDLGPVYGQQWRSWRVPHDGITDYIDQIDNVVQSLRKSPDSRRHIVTAWDPATVNDCALPPCHCLFQFNSRLVDGDRYLDLQLYQRSADSFLGVPFNIASYALLLMMMAQVTGHIAGEFIHSFGDLHIYKNHIPQVRQQLTRAPRALPQVLLNPRLTELEQFGFDDIAISGYDPHPAIKGEVAV